MLAKRACKFVKEDGAPCGAPPLSDDDFCFLHSPDHSEEVAEARRLGGLRRRRERTLSGAYDFEGLASVPQVRRLLEIAVMDTLGLENSVARSRAIVYLAQVAVGLLEKGELEERLAAIEAALGPRLQQTRPTAKRGRWP